MNRVRNLILHFCNFRWMQYHLCSLFYPPFPSYSSISLSTPPSRYLPLSLFLLCPPHTAPHKPDIIRERNMQCALCSLIQISDNFLPLMLSISSPSPSLSPLPPPPPPSLSITLLPPFIPQLPLLPLSPRPNPSLHTNRMIGENSDI